MSAPLLCRSRFVFVGERRSDRARSMGVTWEDGRLCAKTLFEALGALGIAPAEHLFVNAFTDSGKPNDMALRLARLHQRQGATVVGLGFRAQQALDGAGITHLKLIHPAARGSIRRTAAYRAHVAAVLADAGREARV